VYVFGVVPVCFLFCEAILFFFFLCYFSVYFFPVWFEAKALIGWRDPFRLLFFDSFPSLFRTSTIFFLFFFDMRRFILISSIFSRLFFFEGL